MINEPVINDNTYQISGDGSELTIIQFSENPTNSVLIGGENHEYEVGGVNYAIDPERAYRGGPEASNWRIEVVDDSGNENSDFSAVLLVGDEGQSNYPLVEESNSAIKVGSDLFVRVDEQDLIASFDELPERIFIIGKLSTNYFVDYSDSSNIIIREDISGTYTTNDQGLLVI